MSIKTHKSSGFSFIELLVVMVCVTVLLALFGCITYQARENARRIQCQMNLRAIWKAVTAYGLSPNDSFHSTLPNSNITGPKGFLVWGAGGEYGKMIAPSNFICPSMAHLVKPAIKLIDMTETNSTYVCFLWRGNSNGDKALLCDMNGINSIPAPSKTAWGGNHQGQGGNIILVSGSCIWVSIDEITNSQYVQALSVTPPLYDPRLSNWPVIAKY